MNSKDQPIKKIFKSGKSISYIEKGEKTFKWTSRANSTYESYKCGYD